MDIRKSRSSPAISSYADRRRSSTKFSNGDILFEAGDPDDGDPDGGDPDGGDPVTCGDHDHLDTHVLDQIIHHPVDTIFDMVFTKHPFYFKFQAAKKTTDIDIGDWSRPDRNGDRERTITYKIALNYSIGPKSAVTTEKQILRKISDSGRIYVVDNECVTANIPYGESFYLRNRFCLTRLSSNSSRVRITCSVTYLKKVWGLVKNFIEKNVKTATIDSYKLMCELLGEVTDRVTSNNNVGVEKHVKRRRSRPPPEETTTSTKRTKEAGTKKKKKKKVVIQRNELNGDSDSTESANGRVELESQTQMLVKVLACVFLVLLVMNIALFRKLNHVQEMADLFDEARKELHMTNVPKS